MNGPSEVGVRRVVKKRTKKKLCVRHSSKNDDPVPIYESGELYVTTQFYYDGSFNEDASEYTGGRKVVVDYLSPAFISVNGLKNLCNQLGFLMVKDILLKQGSGLVVLQQDRQINSHFLASQSTRHMHIYVNCEGKIDMEQQALFEGEDCIQIEEPHDLQNDSQVVEEQQEINMHGDVANGACVEDEDLDHFSDGSYGMESDTDVRLEVNHGVVDDMFEANIEEIRLDNDLEGGEMDVERGSRKSSRKSSGKGSKTGSGKGKRVMIEEDVADDSEEESESGEENIILSEDEFDSVAGSDDENNEERGELFNEKDVMNLTFKLLMRFTSKRLLKDAITSHAIVKQRSIAFPKNDNVRLYAVCLGRRCKWRLNAKKVKGEDGTFRINHLRPKHICPTSSKVKNISSRWLAKRCKHFFISDPKRSLKAFQEDFSRDIGVDFSATVARIESYCLSMSSCRKEA